MRPRFGAILLLCLAGSAAAATTPGRFDIVTYAAPDGWKVDRAGDHVTLTYAPGTSRYLIVGIYGGQPASGDLAADFRREWGQLVDSQFTTTGAPTPAMTKIGPGIPAAMGMAPATWASGSLVATLFLLDGGGKVASIVVLSPDADAFKANQKRLVGFLAGVGIVRSEAPAPAPPPAQAGAGKTITVADLAGDWDTSAGSVRGGGNGSGGTWAVGSAVYKISADGSYTYKSQGGSSYGTPTTFSETGVFSIDGEGFIVITAKGKDGRRYRFIDWQESSDGTILTLLAEGNKDLMYAEHWGRAHK